MIIKTRIEETLSKIVEVEADNNIEAVSKVAKMYQKLYLLPTTTLILQYT